MNIFRLKVTSIFQLLSKPASTVVSAKRRKLFHFVIVSIVAPVKLSMMPSAPTQASNDLTVVHRPKISFSIDSIVSSKKHDNELKSNASDSEDGTKLSPRSHLLNAIRNNSDSSSPPANLPFSIRHHLLQNNKNDKTADNCDPVNNANGSSRATPDETVRNNNSSSPVSRSPSPGGSDLDNLDNHKSPPGTPTQNSPSSSAISRVPPGFPPGILGHLPPSSLPQAPPGMPPQMGVFSPHAPPPGMLNFAAAAAAAASAAGHHPGLQMWGQPPHPPAHHPVAHPLYPWLLARQARLFPHHRFGPGPDLPGFLFQPFRKPKRIRTAFSPTQLLRLEHAFEKNHYVVGTERKQLAKALGLSETQVKVWFQNRRTKHKRTEQEEHHEKKSVSGSGGSGARSDLHPCGSSADSSTRNFSEEVSDDEELVMDDEGEYSQSDEEHEMLQNNVLHNNHHHLQSHSNHIHAHHQHLQHHHSDFPKT